MHVRMSRLTRFISELNDPKFLAQEFLKDKLDVKF